MIRSSRRRLALWTGRRERLVASVLVQQETLRTLSEDQIQREVRTLRQRARAGTPLRSLTAEAFALTREAARRTLGLQHHPCQLLGGAAMAAGGLAEMATGEGKTLTASLPLVLHALTGRGAHLATVNDYLTQRDAATLRPLYENLGLTLGTVLPDDRPEARHAAYRCDITYAVASELAFDFLRDRLTVEQLTLAGTGDVGDGFRDDARLVQRPLTFVLVDEADSVLIDDARTPYLISGPPGEVTSEVEHAYRVAVTLVERLAEGPDYHRDRRTGEVTLTEAGVVAVRRLAAGAGVTGRSWEEVYRDTERAIRVARDFHRERQYVVRDGEVVLVTESTGRLAEGRHYSGGIHQAIEAKEGLTITGESLTTASVTVQAFFRRYRALSGMTGTASTSAREIRRIYRLPVTPVPTHRPCRRLTWPTDLYATAAEAVQAIVAETTRVAQSGRPVLIGTKSIDASAAVSEALTAAGIGHEVLNAHRHEEEAALVAAAGQAPGGMGRVTVATNMAGRGTDIKLTEQAAAAGGLHVIALGLNDSPRIDRQLAGRSARQGDPGSCHVILTLEDELVIATYGEAAVTWAIARYGTRPPDASPRPLPRRLIGWVRSAQRRREARHALDRRRLLAGEKDRVRRHATLGQDPCLFAVE